MIDLHKLRCGDTIWYQGNECIIVMLRKYYDLNPPRARPYEAKWTISLVDKGSYQEDYLGIKVNSNRTPVYTGEINWEGIEHDCKISNAIDFIREPI